MLAVGRQGRLLRSAYKASSGASGSTTSSAVAAAAAAASSSAWRAPSDGATFATSSRTPVESAAEGKGAPASSMVTVGSSKRPTPASKKVATQEAAKAKKAMAQKGPMQFDLASFPSLLREPHPVLDSYIHKEIPVSKTTPYGGSITIYNDPKYFTPSPPSAASIIEGGGGSGGGGGAFNSNPDKIITTTTPLTTQEMSKMHRHLLKLRRVVQQTGKGRQARMAAFIVTGNGKGMVGIGDGKDVTASVAVRKAYHDALRNMDYVERTDGRTIPSIMTAKWSSSVVVLRPRPPGFGLRVPPVIHAIARCAGIADLSATIHRSTNPLNVAKATLKMLWGGSAPLGMGNGVDGRMRRVDKGRGLRSVRDIEMARGRRLRETSAGKE